MARKKEMVTNVISEEAPIETEDMGTEAVIETEVAEESQVETAEVKSNDEVGYKVKVVRSSIKSIVDKIGEVVEVAGEGVIVKIDNESYLFSLSSIEKV